VTYPLPATTMPPDKIHQTQKAVTAQFLNKMGYSKHILRAITYAPMEIGGIGLCHLGSKQGIQQFIQLIKHLHASNSHGQIYRNLIDAYQIYVGIPNPILEDTSPLSWCPNRWLTQVSQFIHSTNTQIKLECPWTPQPR